MLENGKFNEEILKKIREEKISPIPRWHFLLKDYVVWFFGALSLLIGGAAVSVVIYLLRYNDWSLYGKAGKGFLEHIILTLPYFWVLLLGVFVFLVYLNLKHTKKGYRFSWQAVLGVNILASLILGATLYAAGVGQSLDNILSRQAPFYAQVFNRQIDFWSHPEEGRLTGLVVSTAETGDFRLVDLGQKEWLIISREAETVPPAVIEIGRPLRMTGTSISTDSFQAKKIYVAGPPGRGLFRMHLDKRFPDAGKLEMMRRGMVGDPNFPQHMENMKIMLEKYPELKDALPERMIGNKEALERIVGNHPELEFLLNGQDKPFQPENGIKFNSENSDGNVGAACGADEECRLPFSFAIRSNCPFEAGCITGECRVYCPQYYIGAQDSEKAIPQCTENKDCDCKFFAGGDIKDCLCLDGVCAAVVE